MDFEAIISNYPERFYPTGQGLVSYREAGTGQPIVLLHGISSGAASWLYQLRGLSSKLRVIAWDAPGYGLSSSLAEESPHAGQYAEVLENLVDALSLESFTLVGHSLGALMASAYAYANPQRVKRLVLLSPARGYASAECDERERRYTDRMTRLERLGVEGLASERASALLSASAPHEAIAWVAWNMRRLHLAGYRQAARMLVNDDIGHYADALSIPVTVVSGEADIITPVEKCRVVASLFDHSTYESFAGLGHALYLEEPKIINDLLCRQALYEASKFGKRYARSYE